MKILTTSDSSLDFCGASHETVFQFDIKFIYKPFSVEPFYNCSIQTPLLHCQHLFLRPNVCLLLPPFLLSYYLVKKETGLTVFGFDKHIKALDLPPYCSLSAHNLIV